MRGGSCTPQARNTHCSGGTRENPEVGYTDSTAHLKKVKATGKLDISEGSRKRL